VQNKNRPSFNEKSPARTKPRHCIFAESGFHRAMARPIHIPLSGRDRRQFVRQLKNAPNFETANLRRAVVLRADGEAKLRKARRLECEAWNARLFYGGSAQPSPTVADALFAAFGRREAGCHQGKQLSMIDLSRLRRRPQAELWKFGASLVCEDCRTETGRRTQAHIVGVTETTNGEWPCRTGCDRKEAMTGQPQPKFISDCRSVASAAAMARILELANGAEADKGRISLGPINRTLNEGASVEDYRAGLERAILEELLELHQSRAYVLFAPKGAKRFA